MKNKPNSPTYGKHFLVRDVFVKPSMIARADIPKFLSMLHGVQLDYIDAAVNKSNMNESKEVLQYIMEKK
jgi:hypothetical protein